MMKKRLGKTLYLKYDNFLRRVKVRPDHDGEVKVEESYLKPNDDEVRFAQEETPVVEMASELDSVEENKKLKKEIEELRHALKDEQLKKSLMKK